MSFLYWQAPNWQITMPFASVVPAISTVHAPRPKRNRQLRHQPVKTWIVIYVGACWCFTALHMVCKFPLVRLEVVVITEWSTYLFVNFMSIWHRVRVPSSGTEYPNLSRRCDRRSLWPLTASELVNSAHAQRSTKSLPGCNRRFPSPLTACKRIIHGSP